MNEDEDTSRDLEDETPSDENDPLEEDGDARPDGRSDAKDPWHGLNDFDE